MAVEHLAYLLSDPIRGCPAKFGTKQCHDPTTAYREVLPTDLLTGPRVGRNTQKMDAGTPNEHPTAGAASMY